VLARAVALQPRNVKSALNYGVTLERLGRLDETASFYAGAARSLPDVAEIHFNRGSILARQGRFDEARNAYDRAAALKPAWAAPRELRDRLPHDGAPSAPR
jgi:Flp pilus assembly protein TadD